MNTSAPAVIGLIELPGLAAVLSSAGLHPITGDNYRSAATSIRAGLETYGPFPILLSDGEPRWPGRRAWTEKSARETAVLVLRTADGDGIPFTGAREVALPASIGDILAAVGIAAPAQIADVVIDSRGEVAQVALVGAPTVQQTQTAPTVPTAPSFTAPAVPVMPSIPAVPAAPVAPAVDPWEAQQQAQQPAAPIAPTPQFEGSRPVHTPEPPSVVTPVAPAVDPWEAQQQAQQAQQPAAPAVPVAPPVEEFQATAEPVTFAPPVEQSVPADAIFGEHGNEKTPHSGFEEFEGPAETVTFAPPVEHTQQYGAPTAEDFPAPTVEAPVPVFAPPVEEPTYAPAPTVGPAIDPVPSTPSFEEPVINAPTSQQDAYAFPTAPPVAPAAPIYEAPVHQEPVYAPVPAAPVYEAPVHQEPVYEAPVVEAPVHREPVYAPAPAAPLYEAPVHQEPVSFDAPTEQVRQVDDAPVAGRFSITPAPRQPGLAETVVVWAGKGGVGKSTGSFALAQRAAKAGLRVILIDANFGQGDMRTFLRIGSAGLPSVYQAAISGDLKQALIDPDTLNASRSPKLDPLGFALVLAPPAHLVDPEIVSPEAYLSVVEQARQICDLVVIDTQIVEAKDPFGMVDRLVTPLFRAGAWGFGVTDLSSAGIGNLLTRLKAFAAQGVNREQQVTAMNRIPQHAGFNVDGVASAFNEHSVFLGTVFADDSIIENMNRGRAVSDLPVIAPVLDAALRQITGRGEFNPNAAAEAAAASHLAESSSGKGGLLSRFRRGKN